MLASPTRVAFEIFGFSVYWYGVFMALAVLVGSFVVAKIAEKFHNDKKQFSQMLDILSIVILGALIGARLYFVLFEGNIAEFFILRAGGLSIHGAILGGIISGFLYLKIKNLPFLRYADFTVIGLSLGQSIGRWGNFFNNEAFGKPSSFNFLYIPPEARPLEYINREFFHPAFLYESIWDFGLFLVLLVLLMKLRPKAGKIFFLYLIFYSIGRFFIEGIRLDSIYSVWGMPLAQFVSIILFIIGLTGAIIIQRKD